MNPSERLFVTYATLATLSVAWGGWRIWRTPTVRKAVEALPLAMMPAWIATSYVAFHFGGWDLVLKTLGVGALSLGVSGRCASAWTWTPVLSRFRTRGRTSDRAACRSQAAVTYVYHTDARGSRLAGLSQSQERLLRPSAERQHAAGEGNRLRRRTAVTAPDLSPDLSPKYLVLVLT